MSKKDNKIILITTLGIIGTIIIVLGVTYAYWRLTKEQGGVNIVNSSCLNVTMENQLNDINLENAYPIVDSDGLKLEPFTFTLKNNCEEYADYTISLEMLSITDLNSDFVKVALNEVDSEKNPQKLSSYDEYEDLKLQDTVEGRTITSGKLEPNGEKNYELRIWLDEDVTVDDDAMNKIYKSKVVIESTIGEEPKLVEKICNEKPESIDCQLLKKDENNEELELMYDDTDDKNLRYVGANPNNYIDIGDRYKSDIYTYIYTYIHTESVNNDGEYSSKEECESNYEYEIQEGYGTCEKIHNNGDTILWRIIGVMKNVYNAESGNQEDLIKIIRAESIGDYSWDTSEEEVNSRWGVNEWSQADLMKLLNPNFDNNQDTLCPNYEPRDCQTGYVNNSLYWNNESGQCYNSQENINVICNFASNGLSGEVREKIAKVRWNTGTFATDDETEWTASATYQAERGDIDGKQYCISQGGGQWCNDEVERKTTWDGYIGLMNPSDFGYAVGKSVRNVCLSKSMYYYNEDGCSNANWITSRGVWTLNPAPHRSYANQIFYLDAGNLEHDYVYSYNAADPKHVFPVAFLKSNVTISDALGTKEDPFIAS